MVRKSMKLFQQENKIRQALRKQLWKKGGPNYCFYCAILVSIKTRSFDHLVPQAKGGTWHVSNIVIACVECNLAKADMTVAEFADFVAANGGIQKVKEVYGKGHSRNCLHCNL